MYPGSMLICLQKGELFSVPGKYAYLSTAEAIALFLRRVEDGDEEDCTIATGRLREDISSNRLKKGSSSSSCCRHL